MSAFRLSRRALAAACTIVLSACGGSEPAAPSETLLVAKVVVTAPDSLVTGDTTQLDAVAYDRSDVAIPGVTFSWSTSDEGVAAPDAEGALVAHGYGTVDVTATVSGPASFMKGSAAASASARVGVRLGLATLSAGAYHTCGVARGGGVLCWGEAAWGRLGTGVAYDPWKSVTSPVPALDVANFRSLDADDLQDDRSGHTCAVSVHDVAYCWGSGSWGMLGDGSHGEGIPVYQNPTPTPASGVPAIEQVALGGSHTCLLAKDGSVWCAGSNYFGEIGVSSYTNECTDPEFCVTRFLQVEGGHQFTTITAGVHHNCGLTASGEAWCWGMDVGGLVARMPNPTLVSGALLFKSISAGGLDTCGIALDGTTHCWGNNYLGGAGDGSTTNPVSVPTPVAAPAPLVSVSLGVQHACGLTADGTAYCWGSNEFGQLGTTTSTLCGGGGGSIIACSRTPIAVNTSLHFKALAAGFGHTCGLVANGDAYCWGRNDRGQLGTGDTADRQSPTRVIATR
jgi:alpha-tubulin suppressor-like RCC1 family protein